MKNWEDQIFISIIMPSYNSERTIVRSLESLRRMKKSYPHEVIIVDSSKDDTPQIIQNQFPEFKLIHLEEQTYPGSARNLGLMNAKGNITAFVDSDCIVAEDWLGKLIEAHKKYKYTAIVGSVANGTPRNLIGTVGYLIEFNEFTPMSQSQFINNILGGNVSYKRWVIDRHKLSYTDVFPSEDTIFARDLMQIGEKVFFEPSVIVYHLNRTEFSVLLKHQIVLGRASAQARRMTDIYGKAFINYPILCLGLPFIRLFRAGIRMFKLGIRSFLFFCFISPLHLLCGIYWTAGFMSKGNFKEAKIKHDPGKNKI